MPESGLLVVLVLKSVREDSSQTSESDVGS